MTTMDNLALLKRAVSSNIVAFPTAEDRAEADLRNRVIEWFKDANDALPGDATAERSIYQVPAHMLDGVELISATYTSNATVAADANDTVTLTVSKRDGAGGAATVMATVVTNVAGGAITAFIPKTITLSATLADRQTGAGTIVTFLVAKGMAGKVLGAGHLKLVLKEL